MTSRPSFSLVSPGRIVLTALFLITITLSLISHSLSSQTYPFAKILLVLMRNMVILMLILLAAGIGHVLLRRLRLLSDCSVYNFCLSASIGLVLFSYATFFSLVRLAGVNILLPFWIFIVALSLRELYYHLREIIPGSPDRLKSLGGVGIFFAAVLFILLFYAWYMALTPPFSWDAQVYHLVIPKIYLENNGFVRIPLNVYSNMPHSMDLLFLLSMEVGDDISANLLHYAMGILLCLSLYGFGRRHFSPMVGIIASLLFICHPMVMYEFSVSFIDVGLGLFCFWTAVCCLETIRTGRAGFAFLSGLFAGMCMGAKYTMIATALTAFLILLFYPILVKKGDYFISPSPVPVIRDISPSILFLIPAVFLILPWLIKNELNTGNPIYPLMYSIFGGREWSAQQSSWLVDWQHSIGMGRSLVDYLLLPFRVFIKSNLALGYAGFAGTLYPYILLPLPTLLFIRKNGRIILFIFLFFTIFFIFWAFGAQQVRFLIPALPLLALCSAAGINGLKERRPKFFYALFLTLIAVAPVHLAADHIYKELKREGSYLPIIVGSQTRAEFLRSRVRSYPSFEYLKTHCKPAEQVLLLFENKGYYCPHPYYADSMFEASYFFNMALEAGSPEVFAASLHKYQCRYVVVDECIRADMHKYGKLLYSRQKNVSQFQNALALIERFMESYLEKVFEENQSSVYRFKSPVKENCN